MKCKECHGRGTITLDDPAIISRAITFTCFVCSGYAFGGMTKEQVKWLLTQRKTLHKVRKDFFRARQITNGVRYLTLKTAVNKACAKLGVASEPVLSHVPRYGEDKSFIFTKAELSEYERRLEAIPAAVAAKGNVQVAA
jgi:hypothetical protein